MTICSNRPDGGFGPFYTNGSTHVLTTCFDDTFLEPLGSWVFLHFVPILMLVMLRRRQSDEDYRNREDIELMNVPDQGRDPTTKQALAKKVRLWWGGKWPRARYAFLVISQLLLFALFAMHALEIARLSVDGQGVGLLPFLFVPLIIIWISLLVPAPAWSRGGWAKPARPHGMAFFIGVCVYCCWMMITVGIKLWSYSKVEKLLGPAQYNGVDSKYPYSDRIIDNVVILAVYFSFLMFYAHNIQLEYVRYEWRVFA